MASKEKTNSNEPDSAKDGHRKVESDLLWSLPNWVDNPMNCKKETNVLEELIEAEKVKLSQQHPVEWTESMVYLNKSIGRDFRRAYLVLDEKMQLPNMHVIRCLKFHEQESSLAIGCEKGVLIVLKMNYETPLHDFARSSTSGESLANLTQSQCRIVMNASLLGHNYDLRCLAWSNADGKLVSSDDTGVIIGWALAENGCWEDELINDRSSCSIRHMAWSPDGSKLAVGFEDIMDDGHISGGLLVNYADGVQAFICRFPDLQINSVLWFSDEVVWVVCGTSLYSFDEKGDFWRPAKPLARHSNDAELATLLIKPTSSWVTSESAPQFVAVFRESYMNMFISYDDTSPRRIHLKLEANCADWCQNGLYIVVGGMSISVESMSYPRVHLYNYEGNLLQIIKIPEKTVSAVSWDHDNLHLAISTERHIYFANLRSRYKVASNGKVHCYAFTTNCLSQAVAFWNGENRFVEIFPGKVIDIKCFNDKFSLLCMDMKGVYHIFIFNESGSQEQNLCISTMEPFALTMTKTSVICLAPNAILNWNYNLGNNPSQTGALKATRQVHVDDYPSIIAKPGERTNHLMRPTTNCARCMHAMKDQLCVVRESGRLQLYALPTLGFLQNYQLNLHVGDICQKLSFNIDGTRIALLTMNGQLKMFQFPEANGQATELIDLSGFSSISDLLWASDMPNFLCVLDGNAIHIVKDYDKVETISNIPEGSHLGSFESLEITVIDINQVFQTPECPPSAFIMKLRTPTLAKLESDLVEGEAFEDIIRLLDTSCYNHKVLRKLVAEEALRQGEYTLAEHIYTYDQNYLAVKLFEKILDLESLELKKAEACVFLGDYDYAQHCYIRGGRKDRAIKMWKDLGNWEKVDILCSSFCEDVVPEAIESHFEESVVHQDWERAFDLAGKGKNAEGIMKCCLMMEDHMKLIELADKLSVKDPLLKTIGDVLGSIGLSDEAAKCFIDYEEPSSAMRYAVETRHWDLAIRLSREYELGLIIPSLVTHVKSLIGSNNLNPAIQILERCGKIITVGKLLVWKGLRMLQNDTANLLQVKKIFVLAAQTLSKKKIPVKKSKSGVPSKRPSLNESQELDLEFLIPENQLRIMSGHNEWCWSDPWRGAEAIHFLYLAQNFMYKKMDGSAFKAAMHLKTFEDILGSERIYSLIALTAINEGCLSVASNALVKLEAMDESYTSISYNLFKNHSPQDRSVKRIHCPGCRKSIPDFHSICPFCSTKMFMCVFSACPIIEESEMWTCKVCSRHVDAAKRDRFDYCLLCHSEATV